MTYVIRESKIATRPVRPYLPGCFSQKQRIGHAPMLFSPVEIPGPQALALTGEETRHPVSYRPAIEPEQLAPPPLEQLHDLLGAGTGQGPAQGPVSCVDE